MVVSPARRRDAVPPRRRAGRTPTVTPERVVRAGREIGLAELTITGLAAALGVTSATIHNHVDGIDGLRRMVAEGILDSYPEAQLDGTDLTDDLLALSRALRRFVHDNPGIGQYLANVDVSSPRWLARIDADHARFAAAHRLSPTQAAWLVSTVAEHAIALAEIVYTRAGRPARRNHAALAAIPGLTVLTRVVRVEHDDDWYFDWSMRATIRGTITQIADLP